MINIISVVIPTYNEEKNIEISKLEGLSSMIKGSFAGKTNENLKAWASRQLYLSVGVLLIVA